MSKEAEPSKDVITLTENGNTYTGTRCAEQELTALKTADPHFVDIECDSGQAYCGYAPSYGRFQIYRCIGGFWYVTATPCAGLGLIPR